jgi:hypothetical protein
MRGLKKVRTHRKSLIGALALLLFLGTAPASAADLYGLVIGTDDLGNYRGFLTRQIVAEAKDKLAEGQKEKAESGKETAGAPAPSEIVSRTAIKLQVK